MHLTPRQLRYFVEIARSRSFSRAAEHLHVAQPALSEDVAALEDELGAQLFERPMHAASTCRRPGTGFMSARSSCSAASTH